MAIPPSLVSRARTGELDAQCRVAELHMRRGTAQAHRRAFAWLRLAAAQHSAWAEYHLALAYQEALGTPRNLRLARHWYERAAAAGYASAQLNLGILLASLPAPRRDLRRAVQLYRLAAAQGRRNAAYNLGLYYARGKGVRRSTALALAWFTKAGVREPARLIAAPAGS